MIEISHLSPTATPGATWDALRDLESWGDLLPTFTSVRRVDGPAEGVGARYEVRQPGLARQVYEVTEWAPGLGFTWVARTRGVTTTAAHTIEEADGGTRLTLGVAWSGPMARVARRTLSKRTEAMAASEAATLLEVAATRSR